MNIDIDSSGLDRAEAKLNAVPGKVVGELQDAAQDFLNELQSTTPVDTGALVESEHVVNTDDGATVVIGDNEATYARPVAARTQFVDQARQSALADISARVKGAL